jgi:hypothetical protein
VVSKYKCRYLTWIEIIQSPQPVLVTKRECGLGWGKLKNSTMRTPHHLPTLGLGSPGMMPTGGAGVQGDRHLGCDHAKTLL